MRTFSCIGKRSWEFNKNHMDFYIHKKAHIWIREHTSQRNVRSSTLGIRFFWVEAITLWQKNPMQFKLPTKQVWQNAYTTLKPALAIILLLCHSLILVNSLYAQDRILDSKMHHLRIGEQVEWDEFPSRPEGKQLNCLFNLSESIDFHTLKIRQIDIKQDWHVILNGNILGMLDRDENDKVIYLEVPPETLHQGENQLVVEQKNRLPDDILIGEIVLFEKSSIDKLTESRLEIEVYDEDEAVLLPARLTVTDSEGILQPIGNLSGNNLAIRPGFLYTGNGKANFGLPAGKYTIYATRGFEYGVDSLSLVVGEGDHIKEKFRVKREVPTEGWVSSDTHIHTFTHSGHGDANEEERVLTIAGEGIELPVMTDHNIQVDIEPAAIKMGVRPFFTPVIGNEVTTGIGHFNIFPIAPGSPVPEVKVKSWDELSRSIGEVMPYGAIILNHARDVHGGFRPFDESTFISQAGMSLNGWKVPSNSMEVINSGAHQSDIMSLYRDWFGLLNQGYKITPVGSSDSHDVSRYIIGQARTYINIDNKDPQNIDVEKAVYHFLKGKVMVSFGLLAEMEVNGDYGPGELASVTDNIQVSLRVLGPSWVQANQIQLYANGKLLQKETITAGMDPKAGIKWTGSWNVPLPKQDVFLVAIAQGPDPKVPFWPIGKPYQPLSPHWDPGVIGSSGAVWIDVDGDGEFSSAFEYAHDLWDKSGGNMESFLNLLKPYDESVAIQAAGLLLKEKELPNRELMLKMLKNSSAHTREGFEKVYGELAASTPVY
jgi:hypothetical protein